MKTLLYLIAAVSVLGIATPSNAAPPFLNQRRIVSCQAGGVPVYATYQLVGYNTFGQPIYQWVNQPVRPVYVRPYNYGYSSYRPTCVSPHFGGPVHHGHVSHGGGHGHH